MGKMGDGQVRFRLGWDGERMKREGGWPLASLWLWAGCVVCVIVER